MIILPKNLLQVTPAIKNCIIIGFFISKVHLEFSCINREISTQNIYNLTPQGGLFNKTNFENRCPTLKSKITSFLKYCVLQQNYLTKKSKSTMKK